MTQGLRGSPPPQGYIHQLFLFIISVKQLQHRASTILTLHRKKDLCNSLDPSSLRYNTQPFTICHNHLNSALQASYNCAQRIQNPICNQHIFASLYHLSHSLLQHLSHRPFPTSPRYLFIHYKIGLNMGKPMGRHPIHVTYSQKTKKGPKRGPRSRDLCFDLCSSFDRLSKSQNR